MAAPSNVLFVTRYYWPEVIGSAPFCTDMASWLADHGHKTTVLSGLPHYPLMEIFPGYRDVKFASESVGEVAVERLRVGPPARPSALPRIANEVAFLMRGLGALATGRIARHSLVLALCPSILCIALGIAARKRGGVCVAIVHDIQSGLAETLGMVGRGWLARLMRACERTVLNHTDLICVLSPEMKEQLNTIGVTAPIEVMPLWVDTERLQPAEPVSRPSVKVVYSGNLGRKQGLGQVVALANELARCRPDIEFVLRGSGSQLEELSADIARRGLTNISFADLQPDEALGRSLASGDIHLVPQNPAAAAFAVPSKVFNIMAVGRPFVATAFPGSVLWQLQRQSGAFLCVPPYEPRTFAEAIIKLADDKRLRHELGRRGREFVELHYSKPRILGQFMSRLGVAMAQK